MAKDIHEESSTFRFHVNDEGRAVMTIRPVDVTCVFDRVETLEAFVAQASRVLADVKARAGRTGTLQ